ncbi:tyrosine-type recombinase/integrase [Streptomyces sp. NBC_00829]|uniref:tyrosine-type recombinase/integrase n=1 Tax=Streptomyces sp. NBC_00829 TaxID=2903679 RepID=UPI002F91147A|nr:tyrosine-type recombinase/integrase [Streptomyces sp. NBC_00829]
MSEDLRRLRLAGQIDPVERLRRDLPDAWRGPVIGPDIPDWRTAPGAHKDNLILTGLPETFQVELAWMAHWQEVVDGTPASVQPINQFALVLRRAMKENKPFPASVREMSWETAEALLGWFYATRWKKLLPEHCRSRLRAVFRLARWAMIARCHDGHWWELDVWHPRCNPRIPISPREPHNSRVTPGRINHAWLRAAVKWHLGTSLEAGTLRWSTISQARLLVRFDRWLAVAFDDATDVLGDPAEAPAQAAAFRHWAADPANRWHRPRDRSQKGVVHPRLINNDLQAVGELFAFVAEYSAEARSILGPSSPWRRVTEAHAASWFHQASLRTPRQHDLNDEHYVDDRALEQITAALPLISLPRGQHMTVTRSDGTQVSAEGFGDPQAMRMILLQILTGRRASEVRICEFDCLSPADGPADADGEVIRFRYAQSKIDIAPDTILIDHEVAAVIEEQQQWVRKQFPNIEPRFLFTQRISNLAGTKPYSSGTYGRALRNFSDIVQIRDSKGRPVKLSHTHRFRHTKLTRLAELGLPVHVLMRYAGHATPSMSMHYIAARQEHAEQAFLATAKLKADGTQLVLSHNDHDSLHLFNRADRFLPHGWCLLPPLQKCDKGNACLTCSVFVTDASHKPALERQLAETEALIDRATTAFQERHGRPMPEDNVWLLQRRAEHAALTRLLDTIRDKAGRAVQGAGCGPAPTGPVPLALDLDRHRRTRP